MKFMLDNWRGIIFSTIAAIALHFSYVSGQSSIQSKWDTVKATQAQKQVALSEKYRAQENEAQKQAERIAREDFDKRNAALASATTARAATDGLRSDIDALNASVPTKAEELAASLGQARAARDALGQCADRYSSVAAIADELTIQVTGLQDFIATAIPEPQ